MVSSCSSTASEILGRLGLNGDNLGGFCGEWLGSGPELEVLTPIDGSTLASVRQVTEQEYDAIVERAREAFLRWRDLPAPKRGEVVRQLGDRLRAVKEDLGALVTLEMGKILAEGRGEVQEMIDICDFATGLSRQLYGLTMASERPDHRMFERVETREQDAADGDRVRQDRRAGVPRQRRRPGHLLAGGRRRPDDRRAVARRS